MAFRHLLYFQCCRAKVSRSFPDHHRDLVGRGIDNHDVVLYDDVAEGRNLRNLRYQGIGEGKQRDTARDFGAEGKADQNSVRARSLGTLSSIRRICSDESARAGGGAGGGPANSIEPSITSTMA